MTSKNAVETRSDPASAREMKQALADSIIIGESSTRNPFSNRNAPALDKPLPTPGSNGASGTAPRKSKSAATSKGGATKPSGKKEAPFDVIDRLDISGLYGGGAFHRHDGPYAAASANRNKGSRAPIMAFDPAALSPTAAISSPSSSRSTPRPIPARAISNQSPRTQHGIDKLDQRDLDPHDGAKKDGRRSRRNSDGSVTMGFPNAAGVSGKGQQLVEMFGVRDNEAWEDFGTSRFKGDRGASANSKESIAPPVVKQDRISRTDSIWDIEATLKAGKPVGQAPPPPLPAFPSNYDFTASEKDSFSTDNKPKRSKSLVARFRGARKNPDNPMGSDEPAESSPSSRRMNAAQRSADSPAVIPETHSTIPSSAPQPIRTRAVNFDETGLATSPTEARGNGSRFNGGAILGASRSLGPEVKLDGAKYEEGALARGGGGSGGLGRRPSVMQRLFRGKAK